MGKRQTISLGLAISCALFLTSFIIAGKYTDQLSFTQSHTITIAIVSCAVLSFGFFVSDLSSLKPIKKKS